MFLISSLVHFSIIQINHLTQLSVHEQLELLTEASGPGSVDKLYEALEPLQRCVRVGGLFPAPVVGLGKLVLVGVPPNVLEVPVNVHGLPVGHVQVFQPPRETLSTGISIEDRSIVSCLALDL